MCTPLVAAAWGRYGDNASGDYTEIIRMLLERNADIEALGYLEKGISGTLLFIAAVCGNGEIVQLLLDFGAQKGMGGTAYDPNGYEIDASRCDQTRARSEDLIGVNDAS
ncbi:hypothetical protein N7533_013134 [Penicillium manginii]|uniref:uncharacterized protein n=1 Tax=Penicillium manginii TaxID=203109 RepID=UPI002546A6A4|nr:uncharacterized protein N7533_013134 [Penicillium manginii]KAJ5734731.1 hypothetical protein N7533_013134 [Penicillium manginii]